MFHRTRHGRALGTLAACGALALCLIGCSSAAPPAPSDDAEQTESPSTPSAEQTPAEDDAWPISVEGIGPFEIGMRYADALTVPDAEVSEICEGVAQVTIPSTDAITMWVSASEGNPESTIAEISISAPADSAADVSGGPVTEEGIGLGARVDDVTAAYPDARELDDTGVPGRTMYYVSEANQGMIFTAGDDGDVIWQISVTAGDVPSYEPCA